MLRNIEGGCWDTNGNWAETIGGSKRTKPILVCVGDRFRYAGYGRWSTVSILWYDENGTIVSVAEYWGIPYLDLKGDARVPMLIGGRYGTVSEKAAALRNAAFQVSDTDAHPNVKCHEYRATVIENF